MNEVEKRRRELLEQTRYSYQESGIPAIHPRYRASYSELYGEEEAEQGSQRNPYIYLYDSVCGVCIYAE